MNKEEIKDILDELHLVRPEILQPKAKKLFEAIMSIADERDDLLKQNEELKLVRSTCAFCPYYTENEKLNHYKKLYQILKREKEELRSWLEEEKDRLARECSQIYEDSLGKTRLVNEDIFNEVNRIISKLNELEGGKNE